MERVILHYFSGRRRIGDLQYYIEQQAQDGALYWVVSLDVMVDATRGNLLEPATQTYWLAQIHAGYVICLVAGPPCETWSIARGQLIQGEDRLGPRILRTTSHPWGLDSLGLRELRQLYVGSGLLLFVFESLIAMALRGGCALLEHPAEHQKQAATIWKLCATALLERIPGFCRHRIYQGDLGSESNKPTDLLALHLDTLQQDLAEHRLGGQRTCTASIGRHLDGSYKTARLKEYWIWLLRQRSQKPSISCAVRKLYQFCLKILLRNCSNWLSMSTVKLLARTFMDNVQTTFESLVLEFTCHWLQRYSFSMPAGKKICPEN